MLIAISTKSQRQTRKPRFVAVAPSRFRMSADKLANTWAAPPDRVNQLRTSPINRSRAIKLMPMMKTSVRQAGSFSGEDAGVGVADWKKKSASGISGSYFAKADFDVAKRDQVTFVYGVRFTVSDSLPVDVRAIRRSSVSNQ